MNWPNLLSLLRLCLVPVLLALAWLRAPQAYFWTLLLALGTDAVDGVLARRLGQASPLGARLDSRADLALFLTVPAGIWLLFPEVVRRHAAVLAALIGAYLLADLIGYVRFRRLTSYHTRGAKVAAVLLGVTVLALFWIERWIAWLLYPSAALAVLAYLEEIAITLTLPGWEADVPSWWHARRRPGPPARHRLRTPPRAM